jgi:hypothetical protein
MRTPDESSRFPARARAKGDNLQPFRCRFTGAFHCVNILRMAPYRLCDRVDLELSKVIHPDANNLITT